MGRTCCLKPNPQAQGSSLRNIFQVLGDMSVSKVYIGNLAEDARDRDIEKLFKGYGRVRNIVVKHEGGYGFAQLDDREDAKDAVKDLDGTSFMGSRLRIEHARDSRDRSPSSAKSESRSRSRS